MIFDRVKPLDAILATAQKKALVRTLGAFQLTLLGVGAVIGTGIFVLTSEAAQKAGPGMLLSFVVAGFVCAVAALCYAELASMIPAAGSAYAYTYTTMGEFPAWLIGWFLVLEYTVASAAVASGWSGYFTKLLSGLGLHIPDALTHSPLDPTNPGIMNAPAAGIALVVTVMLIFGVRENARVNAAFVLLKVAVLLAFIFIALPSVNPTNWQPFLPFGMQGVIAGGALIFFAYIGFDAVATTAEECKNPQRDLPIGILASLAVCTVLYIAMAAVMTGLSSYTLLGTDEPVVTALHGHPQLEWLRWLVEIGALLGLSSVVLVMIIAQPRIFMIMGRDGMLPKVFTRIHPRYRTPHLNTLITGAGIALLAAIFPLDVLGDLVSMGTLIAFMAVCAGVWILRHTRPELPRTFRVPFAPVICTLGILSCLALLSTMAWYNWSLMIVWTLLGLVIYFGYGNRHSHLRRTMADTPTP